MSVRATESSVKDCNRPIAAVRERTPKTVPQAAVQAPECAVQDSFKHWTAARWRIDYPIRIRQEE
jgi:hypothetical protein